jgi:SAM-dependent methyltransferase
MKTDAFHSLRRVEEKHWFYSGKRLIALHWVRRLEGNRVLIPKEATALDLGCGTGLLLSELGNFRRKFGLEVAPEALKLLHPSIQGNVAQASALHLPLRSNALELVTCFDVIEHIDDDRSALAEIARVLKPGGVLMLNVPAYQWMFGDWDVQHGHFRRYDQKGIGRLLLRSGFEILHLSYENLVGLIGAMLVRTLRKILPAAPLRIENDIPSDWFNSLLRSAYVLPARGASRYFNCGLSVWSVARKLE